MGLLDRLKRVAAYHFETEILFIDPSTPEDYNYLSKGPTFQQLELLAQDATKIREVRICNQGKFPAVAEKNKGNSFSNQQKKRPHDGGLFYY